MTRQETISAAQAFTEKHKESHKIYLENGYIEATTDQLYEQGLSFFYPKDERKMIWAIDQNGVFTTEFV